MVDLILVMSVNPGFGGQKFIESQVEKIRAIKAMCKAKGARRPETRPSRAKKPALAARLPVLPVLPLLPLACAPLPKTRLANPGVNPWIEVDGGVTPANAYKVIEAGANAIVSGSGVYGAKSYAEASQEPRPRRVRCQRCVRALCREPLHPPWRRRLRGSRRPSGRRAPPRRGLRQGSGAAARGGGDPCGCCVPAAGRTAVRV